MRPLDPATVRAIIEQAAETVRGDWVLMGGTVLPLIGADARPTLDIDLVPLGEVSRSEILELMEITEAHGLPVETLNQAGEYFLKKISDFRDHLVPLHEGSRARILRPDATLYILLKLRRMTPSDLEDCLSMHRAARASGEDVDVEGLRTQIRKRLEEAASEGRRGRLEDLLSAL